MTSSVDYDLVVLAAGKNESEIIRTILEKRHKSIGISPVRCAMLTHPRRDPGCLRESPLILQTYLNRAAHALVVFDWEGSGHEARTASELEQEVTAMMEASGWTDRCAVVVIKPEVETWLWANSPHVSRTFGWGDDYAALVATLEARGFSFLEGKPDRPKEAVETCLKEKRIQRSSALYAQIAEQVSLARCNDRSFQKLRAALIEWFGIPTPTD